MILRGRQVTRTLKHSSAARRPHTHRPMLAPEAVRISVPHLAFVASIYRMCASSNTWLSFHRAAASIWLLIFGGLKAGSGPLFLVEGFCAQYNERTCWMELSIGIAVCDEHESFCDNAGESLTGLEVKFISSNGHNCYTKRRIPFSPCLEIFLHSFTPRPSSNSPFATFRF